MIPAVEAPRILYAGPPLAGVTTSLRHFLPRPVENWSADEVWEQELADGVHIDLPSGRFAARILLRQRGALGIGSLHDALTQDRNVYARDRARRVVPELPRVVGVVFVVDSQAVRMPANQEYLEGTINDLVRAGVDVERLPFVFQVNKRDGPFAVPMPEIAKQISKSGCQYVESVAPFGYGVREALARALVPGDPAWSGRLSQSRFCSPRRIFDGPTSRPLTTDGEVSAELEIVAGVGTLTLGDEVKVGWGGADNVVNRTAVPGRYQVDVVRSRARYGLANPTRQMVVAVRASLGRAVASVEVRRPGHGPSHVLVGAASAVRAYTREDPSLESELWGAGVVVARHDASAWFAKWKTTRQGNFLRSDSSSALWLGRDATGRVCEIGALSDSVRTMLGEVAWGDGDIVEP